MLSVTPTLRNLPQCVNSGKSILETSRRNAILWGKGDSTLSYSGIDEILVSYLTETEKCRRVNLIRQSHLTNLKAAENGFMLLLWWCPFKIQKEKRAGLQFIRTDYLSLLLTPPRIRWTIPLNCRCPPLWIWIRLYSQRKKYIYRRRWKYRRGFFCCNFRAPKKTFSTFSFRIIYFRMLRIRIFFKNWKKNFGVLSLSLKKSFVFKRYSFHKGL
jgi:hypothetical protein